MCITHLYALHTHTEHTSLSWTWTWTSFDSMWVNNHRKNSTVNNWRMPRSLCVVDEHGILFFVCVCVCITLFTLFVLATTPSFLLNVHLRIYQYFFQAHELLKQKNLEKQGLTFAISIYFLKFWSSFCLLWGRKRCHCRCYSKWKREFR